MLVVPGRYGKDTCDGYSRRELLRVGGTTLAGLSLPALLKSESAHAADEGQRYGGPGFGKAKSVILVYLQGGPSHLDLWDPKEDVPDNVRSVFKPIATKTARRAVHRTAAEAGPGDRQGDDDPLDELHADRPVQSHGRHLSDA